VPLDLRGKGIGQMLMYRAAAPRSVSPEQLLKGGSLMRSIVLATVVLLTGSSLSLAQGHMGTPQEQQACKRDAQRFCRNQLGDDGAVQQCLQQQRSRLSKSCQRVFQSHGM
jgi:Cysteine rich repeat